MENRVLFLEKIIETSSILPTLASNNNSYEIDAISSIEEAVKLIKKQKYNLIYVNIDFLDMRIISLFEGLINKKCSCQLIFSGDYKNPRIIKKMEFFKSMDVLIKPFDKTWLRDTIIDHFKTGKPIANKSEKILSLFFIFKLIDFEKGSIAFKINFDGKKGLIVVENGIVVHSKFDKNEGLLALKNIIETDPSNKKEISITTPGFLIKKDTNINLASLLESYDNSAKVTEGKKKSTSSSYTPLISHMIEKMKVFHSENAKNIIENTIIDMGFSIETLPASEEIDLIINVSSKINQPDKRAEFKTDMVKFFKAKK